MPRDDPSQEPPLNIALLSYRSHPYCGGQGVYVRNLSHALCRLGHRVTVISGPPYPQLDNGARLQRFPDDRLTVILLTNSGDQVATSLARKVAGLYWINSAD